MSSHVACRAGEALTLGAPARQCAPSAEPSLEATLRLAVRIAGALTGAVLAVGIAVHLASAGSVRRLLAFHFPGVPAHPAAAATVFLHNLHALLAISGALLVAQSPYLVTRAARPGRIHQTGWRTPRYATGRYPVPQIGQGQRRHPITLNEIPVADGKAIIDLELKTFAEIKPDRSLELRIEPLKLTFDLLVEVDLTARPSYNREKFLAYDAFLCGWGLAHPRYRALGTRPAVVFVSSNNHAALACAQEADELMTGRIGVMGASAEQWHYAGRDHLFFAVGGNIHHGELTAWALPLNPPGLRERLSGSRELALERVRLLPDPAPRAT